MIKSAASNSRFALFAFARLLSFKRFQNIARFKAQAQALGYSFDWPLGRNIHGHEPGAPSLGYLEATPF